MATFTHFKAESLARYLIMFELGELHAHTPITDGIENSNYYVTLENEGVLDEYVLTIAESLSFDEVAFFNDLIAQLYHRGLPVPAPQSTLDGMTSTSFCGKPTWLFSRLTGSHPQQVNPEQCYNLGAKLAELHESAKKTRYSRSNPYDTKWQTARLAEISTKITPAEQQLLNEVLSQYIEFDPCESEASADLPRGIIHGDLFRDNCLLEGNQITGIIDFFHASEDYLVQDIAISINDWCSSQGGKMIPDHRQALLDGYQSIRELTEFELDALLIFQRFAAMRFILTRFSSGDNNNGEPLKDPNEFLNLLRHLSQA
ncbi:MAG: homoserine kinase [Pseudomonadales bacterium]|nr:homoserine kinase [Pseudomonadales bacterium]